MMDQNMENNIDLTYHEHKEDWNKVKNMSFTVAPDHAIISLRGGLCN